MWRVNKRYHILFLLKKIAVSVILFGTFTLDRAVNTNEHAHVVHISVLLFILRHTYSVTW